ncbi:MAG: hypothetical protein KKD39_05590, partial [Candidatus Altiarchaeota archaeon]|nr:hypothetical protein [Candidatus Altiarchaeota archaeon]
CSSFSDRFLVEVNNGVEESGWKPLDASSAIDAANSGDMGMMHLRVRALKDGPEDGHKLLDMVSGIIKTESWEDLMQTHGIMSYRKRDLLKNLETFTSTGTGTGITLAGRLVYAPSFDSPPPNTKFISEDEVGAERKKLELALKRAALPFEEIQSDAPEGEQQVIAAQRELLLATGRQAIQLLSVPVESTMSVLTGEQKYMNADMAVQTCIESKMKEIRERQPTGSSHLLRQYEEVRADLMDALSGSKKSEKWSAVTKNLPSTENLVLLILGRPSTSEIAILQKAGFSAVATPVHTEGLASHLFAAGKADLFPVLMGLYGVDKADGYDIIGLGKYAAGGLPCLLIDQPLRKGGSQLILNPPPELLEEVGLASGSGVVLPFKKHDSFPVTKTQDGVNVDLRFNMDTLDPRIVEIAAKLGLRGGGMTRLDFELRFLGDGWTFEPGQASSRETLKRYLKARIINAVQTWEKHAFPENRGDPFTIRIADLRPSDPDKMPYVFSEIAPKTQKTSSALLLEFKDDLLIPMVEAVDEASKHTGHPMNLMFPDVRDGTMFWEIQEAVQGRLPVIPQIESLEGIRNMRDMGGAAAFCIGVNDLTSDVTGLRRSNPRYHQLYSPVLKAIADAKKASDELGVPVKVCSNIAESKAGIRALLGLGITDISLPVTCVEGISEQLPLIDCGKARASMDAILSEEEPIPGDEVYRRLHPK